MFFCFDLAKGTIAHYYDSLSGILNGGLSSMFNPCLVFMPYSQQTPKTNIVPQRIENLVKNIYDLIFKLISNISKNNMLMQHLLLDSKQVVGRQ
jgi:hypothetical protein